MNPQDTHKLLWTICLLLALSLLPLDPLGITPASSQTLDPYRTYLLSSTGIQAHVRLPVYRPVYSVEQNGRPLDFTAARRMDNDFVFFKASLDSSDIVVSMEA